MSRKKYATEEERVAAKRAYDRARYAANREKKLAMNKAYHAANREKTAAQDRAYREANREKTAARHKAYHGANREKRAAAAKRYHGANLGIRRTRKGLPPPARPEPDFCELCGRIEKRRLCLDHCHGTGAFRGWLCDRCNRGLGFFDDNIEGLKRAIAYLKRAYGVA